MYVCMHVCMYIIDAGEYSPVNTLAKHTAVSSYATCY